MDRGDGPAQLLPAPHRSCCNGQHILLRGRMGQVWDFTTLHPPVTALKKRERLVIF